MLFDRIVKIAEARDVGGRAAAALLPSWRGRSSRFPLEIDGH
jgi:hypothetical protein